jgi:hypothetical protein
MRDTRSCLAVVEPLFNGLVFLPGVVSSEGLRAREIRVIEDLIFLLQYFQGLLSCLVFLLVCLSLINECLLSYHVLVLLYYTCVSGGQTLYLKVNSEAIIFK